MTFKEYLYKKMKSVQKDLEPNDIIILKNG
jgi:hypothetical protein